MQLHVGVVVQSVLFNVQLNQRRYDIRVSWKCWMTHIPYYIQVKVQLLVTLA